MASEVITTKANLLKSKRVLKGLTQKKVAEMVGVSEKTYNHKETGKIECKIDEILIISSVLDLTMEDINEIFFNGNLPFVQVKTG